MGRINKEKFKVYSGVFDEHTLSTLESLKRKKYYDELKNPIKTGKESDVYSCVKDNQLRAIKIYRVTNANFKKISEYINRDFRFKTVRGNIRKVIMMWTKKEFRNLQICHKAHMNVPYPFKQENNVIIMEHIDGLMLKDIHLDNPQQFFELLLQELNLLKNSAKLIHGDLSEFNILVKNQKPVIIDMGQSMSIKNDDDFKNLKDLYQRDLKNVVNYFNKKYSLELELDEIFKKLDE